MSESMYQEEGEGELEGFNDYEDPVSRGSPAQIEGTFEGVEDGNQVSSPPTPDNILQKQSQIRNSQMLGQSNHYLNSMTLNNKRGSVEQPSRSGFPDEEDQMELLYRSKDIPPGSSIQRKTSPIKTGYSHNLPEREGNEESWPKAEPFQQSIDNYSQERKSIATDNQSVMVPQTVFQKEDLPSQQNLRSQVSSVNQERLDFLQNKFGSYKTESKIFTYEHLLEKPDFMILRFKDALYRGEIKDKDQREGLGVMVYEKSGRVYEGGWVNDRRHGKGYERYSNGNVYQGDFERGKANGYGVYLWKNGEYYEGEWLNGQKHGQGEWKNQTGDRYTGEWKDNKANGSGEHIWGTGDRYQGDWVNFLKHGYGTDFFANGDKYVGKYRYGKPWGFGKYYWATGAVYEGEFVEGKKCGKGRWEKRVPIQSQRSPGSDSTHEQEEPLIYYEGEYNNDVKEGYGKYRWATGNFYQGNYLNDKRHFYGEMFWTDGSVYKGEWNDGVQNGYGKMSFANGELKEGLFQNGVFKYEGSEEEILAILQNQAKRKKEQELDPISKKGLKASSGRRLKKVVELSARDQQHQMQNYHQNIASENSSQGYSRKPSYQQNRGGKYVSNFEDQESNYLDQDSQRKKSFRRKQRPVGDLNTDRYLSKNESAPALRIEQQYYSPINHQDQERLVRNQKIYPHQTTKKGNRVSAPFTDVPDRVMRMHQLSNISELSMEHQTMSKRGSSNTFLPEIREKVRKHQVHSQDSRLGRRQESVVSGGDHSLIAIQNQRFNQPSSLVRKVSSQANLQVRPWISQYNSDFLVSDSLPSDPVQRNDGIRILGGQASKAI